ncbi:hypothetical protein PR048_017681 [Dryococelus australis]|uniref:Uncharacterized protein n=1 Tax=Dryococelus australis TaxID=614101 RepID=A0ABQ9HA64_9NEOP|nr:hypothetical protein PR048_017681 [Dryococelus australis]
MPCLKVTCNTWGHSESWKCKPSTPKIHTMCIHRINLRNTYEESREKFSPHKAECLPAAPQVCAGCSHKRRISCISTCDLGSDSRCEIIFRGNTPSKNAMIRGTSQHVETPFSNQSLESYSTWQRAPQPKRETFAANSQTKGPYPEFRADNERVGTSPLKEPSRKLRFCTLIYSVTKCLPANLGHSMSELPNSDWPSQARNCLSTKTSGCDAILLASEGWRSRYKRLLHLCISKDSVVMCFSNLYQQFVRSAWSPGCMQFMLIADLVEKQAQFLPGSCMRRTQDQFHFTRRVAGKDLLGPTTKYCGLNTLYLPVCRHCRKPLPDAVGRGRQHEGIVGSSGHVAVLYRSTSLGKLRSAIYHEICERGQRSCLCRDDFHLFSANRDYPHHFLLCGCKDPGTLPSRRGGQVECGVFAPGSSGKHGFSSQAVTHGGNKTRIILYVRLRLPCSRWVTKPTRGKGRSYERRITEYRGFTGTTPKGQRTAFVGTQCNTIFHKDYFLLNITITGATVAERLARPPPTKANRVQSPAESPDFHKWESYRTMPLVGGPSRGSPTSPATPVPPHNHFNHPHRLSRPRSFTHYPVGWARLCFASDSLLDTAKGSLLAGVVDWQVSPGLIAFLRKLNFFTSVVLNTCGQITEHRCGRVHPRARAACSSKIPLDCRGIVHRLELGNLIASRQPGQQRVLNLRGPSPKDVYSFDLFLPVRSSLAWYSSSNCSGTLATFGKSLPED